MIRAKPLCLALIGAAIGRAACQPATETTVDVPAQLNALYAEYDEDYLAMNPLSATFRGDNRFNDQWYPLDPLSDEYEVAALAMDKRYLARLNAIDSAALDCQDLLSYEIFRLER